MYRASTAGDPAPETVRRLMRHVLAHQADHLQDDASLIVLEWRTGDERQLPVCAGTGPAGPSRPAPPETRQPLVSESQNEHWCSSARVSSETVVLAPPGRSDSTTCSAS